MQQLALEGVASPSSQDSYLDIGQIFMQARQERRLDLSEIAEYLHIRQVYLEAIEQGNFHSLPGRVYTLGFMKKYAEFLKLDFQELQRRLDLRVDSYTTLVLEDIMQPYTTVGYKKYIWLSLILTVIGGGGYTYIRLSHAPEPATDGVIQAPDIVEVPSSTEAAATDTTTQNNQNESQPIQQETTPSEITLDKPAAETVVALAARSPILVLHAVQPTWIDIRNAVGQSLFSRVLQKGESYTLPSQKGLVMTVGNAGGLEMMKDGVELPSLGGPGQVRRGLSVDQVFSLAE